MPFCMVSGYDMSPIDGPASKDPFCSTICTMKEEANGQLNYVGVQERAMNMFITKYTFP